MFTGLSTTEIVIILVVLVAIFGSKRMAELAKDAGQATKKLNHIKKDYEKTVKEVTDLEKGGDSHT